jgi:protein-tyrosine phosphatase
MLPSYEELTADRNVIVDGVWNMRDLGGLPRRDGGVIPHGRYFRADNLANLSPAGVDALVRLGVRTVVDLRRDETVREWPNPLNGHSEVAYYQVDMIGDHVSAASDVIDAAWHDADPESRAAAFPVFSHLRDYCRWLDERQPQIRTIMGLLTRERAGAVVYHCEAGKDRTGVVTTLLLLLAGVPDLAIAADYTHTAHNNFRRLELLHAEGKQELAVRDAAEYARRFCPVELIPILLFWLRSRYGDITSYLSHIGLPDDEVATLRNALSSSGV